MTFNYIFLANMYIYAAVEKIWSSRAFKLDRDFRSHMWWCQ